MKHVKIYNYADDTSTSCSGKNLEEVIKNLEEDANNILNYMASNGLVANASKTVFMILGLSKQLKEKTHTIKVGESIIEASDNTKLLGMTIQDNQKNDKHFNGTGGLIPSLNQRLFTIRRVANQVPNKQLKKLACSLWMSKLRYGLHLSI